MDNIDLYLKIVLGLHNLTDTALDQKFGENLFTQVGPLADALDIIDPQTRYKLKLADDTLIVSADIRHNPGQGEREQSFITLYFDKPN